MGHGVNEGVLVTCALVLVSVLAVRLSRRTGVPQLLVYLAIGLILGDAGFGVRVHDFQLAEQLSLVALAIILAEGGLTTRWQEAKDVAAPAIVLATIGVAVNVAVVGGICTLVLGSSHRTGLLLGAAVAATDSAAVFSVMRRLPLRRPLGSLLEAECGLNDAPTTVLVALASSSSWGTKAWWVVLLQIAYQLLLGLGVGLAVGYGGRALLGRLALPSAGLYPIATVALVLVSFGLAGSLGASSFIAVYVSGVLVGSARLPHRRAVLGFATSLASLAEMGLFVLLGLVVSPSGLWSAVPDALIVGAATLLLGRPLAVLISLTPFRFGLREQLFLDWSGLRGAVPIVLAIVPVAAGTSHGTEVLDVVFVLVVLYTLLQAPTLPWVGRRLGVVEDLQARDLEVEAAPLETVGADLLQVTVRPGSHLHGVYVDELRLPPGAVLSLVVRDGVGTVPTPNTILQRGDQLLVVATTASRVAAEERLRAVSQDGKLARWYGGRTAAVRTELTDRRRR